MEEDRYVRVLGILHRDMYDILDKEMRTEENKDMDPLETLQKMARDIVNNESKLGGKLDKVIFDREKKKFDMKFK